MNVMDLVSGVLIGGVAGWYTRTMVYNVQRKVRHVRREAGHFRTWLALGAGAAVVLVFVLAWAWHMVSGVLS